MSRIIKEPLVRRNEILDAAQRFMFTRGYEPMTIQDILDDLKLSKGAFYHYFISKDALLEALIERLEIEGRQMLIPILHDPQMNALEKLQRFIESAATWKTAQKEYLLALVRVWYAPENAVVRQRSQASMFRHIEPDFTELIHQGIDEGSMKTDYPGQIGKLILTLFQALGDATVEVLLKPQPEPGDGQRLDEIVAAYTNSIERLLGITPGTLTLIDHETMQKWVVLKDKTPE